MNRNQSIFIILIILFFSCNKNISTNNNSNLDNNNDSLVIKNSSLNEYANFLGGQNCKLLEDIQKKDFYKIYQRTATTNWNFFYTNLLSVITSWTVSNKLTSKDDTLTVFYPFSGPDFPFVHSFYPYSNTYIFVGLENLGQIPEIDKLTDYEIDRYINALAGSMTDYFLNGYFSTLNLKNSFRSQDMNGIVHPMLFFINKMNYQIVSFKYFYIDKYGKIQYIENIEPLSKNIRGFEFWIENNNQKKRLIYIQFDLSDQNFSNYPEFYTFISNFGQKNVFIKSASYLLQNEKFSLFRSLIIRQFNKIVQDDSGLSYKLLKDNNFEIVLFGNYKQTLNIFNKYYQKDLKEAYNSVKPKQLPFRFGYNIPFDQTTIIFVKNNDTLDIDYPFYSVQFKISWNRLSADSFPPNISNIDYYYDEGYYKYICGKYQTKEQAEEMLKKLGNMGYKDAFVVEFQKYRKKILQ